MVNLLVFLITGLGVMALGVYATYALTTTILSAFGRLRPAMPSRPILVASQTAASGD